MNLLTQEQASKIYRNAKALALSWDSQPQGDTEAVLPIELLDELLDAMKESVSSQEHEQLFSLIQKEMNCLIDMNGGHHLYANHNSTEGMYYVALRRVLDLMSALGKVKR